MRRKRNQCSRIDGYDRYNVDVNGVVRNEHGRELKHDVTHDGYHRVTLYNNGKSKHIPVHRLVANAFIPNPENKPTVNHKNGDKSDNRVSNLEWSTRSENSQHAYDNGLNRCHFTCEDRQRGWTTLSKTTSKPVRIVETNEIYSSATQCAKRNGFDSGNIISCCNGNRPTHRGYHFEWV